MFKVLHENKGHFTVNLERGWMALTIAVHDCYTVDKDGFSLGGPINKEPNFVLCKFENRAREMPASSYVCIRKNFKCRKERSTSRAIGI